MKSLTASRKTLQMLAITAIFTALYFVLSTSLKISFIGNISLDLGYIALTVASVLLGAWQAAFVGACGCAIESLLLSAYGFSISWFVMNCIIGIICGFILPKTVKSRFKWLGFAIIIVSVLIGISAKTIIECNLYSIPFMIKLPKAIIAFIIDSITMCIAYPFAIKLKLKFS